jgi:DNA-directed RNA polymerase specialized sigma24 family protein
MGASQIDPDNGRPLQSTLSESCAGRPRRRHIDCEILSCLPLLRALAKVRSASGAEADALVQATLERALADFPKGVPSGDLRPWLLGLQRSVHASRQANAGAVATEAVDRPARGANAMWHLLHRALLRLPDRQREAVMLVDGAHCTPDELAELLDCSPDEAGRLVTHARAALLARLRATQRLPFPPERATSARRPGSRAGDRRPRSGHTDDTLHPSRSAEARGSRQAFAQRLNVTLLRALVPNAVDPVERQGLKSLIDGQTAADGVGGGGGGGEGGGGQESPEKQGWAGLRGGGGPRSPVPAVPHGRTGSG